MREYKDTIDALGYRADKTIEVSKYALSVAIADVEKAYAAWNKAEKQEKDAREAKAAPKDGQSNTDGTREHDLDNAIEQLKKARKEFDDAIENVDKKKKELMNAKTEAEKADEAPS